MAMEKEIDKTVAALMEELKKKSCPIKSRDNIKGLICLKDE